MHKNYLTLILFFILNSTIYAATRYVNPAIGNDSYNGNSATVGMFPDGPKASILSALLSAQENDNIVINAGNYLETVTITKNFNFIISNNVSIKTIVLNAKDKSLNMIGQQLYITDSLVLNLGKIDVSTGLQLYLRNNCAVIGGNHNSFVDGPLFIEKASTTTSLLYFPIGNEKDFRPVNLRLAQASAALNTYVAKLNKGGINYSSTASSINRVSKIHSWYINKIGNTPVTSLSISIDYDSSFTNDGVNNSKNLLIGHDSNGIINDLNGIANKNFDGVITRTNLPEKWGNFTLCNKKGGINSLGYTVPYALFGINGACINTAFKFIDSSFSTDVIKKWDWDFDYINNKGVHTATVKNPQFTFTGTGPYSVKLTVTNNLGEKDSIIKNIRPIKAPSVSFTANNACIGDSIFTKNLTPISDSVKSWLWEINGSTFIDKEPKLKINKTDTSILSLTATNIYGCKDTLLKKVVLHNKPAPQFSFSQLCLGDTTLFTNSSQIKKDTILNNSWYINNKLASNTKKFKTIFPKDTSFQITLVCKSSHNCVDSITKTTTISKTPVVSFGLANTKNNNYTQCYNTNNFSFIDSTIANSLGQLDYKWEASNGDKSNVKNPSFSFIDAGKYKIKLIAENSAKCIDSAQKEVTILPETSISFSEKIPCFPDSLTLYPSYKTPQDSIISIQWNMADGTIVNSKDSFKYEYKTKGKYDLEVKICTKNNCIDSFTKAITIVEKPDAKIKTNSNPSICKGDSLLLIATGANSYLWLNNNSSNTSIYVRQPGKYILQGSSTNNCYGYDTVEVIVNPKPIANAGEDTSLIRGKSISLNATGGQQYKWTPNTYLDLDNIANPITSPKRTISYLLEVTDLNGCKDTDSLTITVMEPGEIKIVNLLTPNGDGHNDFWDLSDLPELNTCNISVYNRNGVLVYNTTDYQNDWDGTWKGTPLPEGNYFYYIHCDSEKEDFKGSILILR